MLLCRSGERIPSLARDYFIRDTKLPDDNLAAVPGHEDGEVAALVARTSEISSKFAQSRPTKRT